MAAIITQSCSGGWIAQKHTSMTKPILRLLKLNKGIDLLRCFEDMSLRDASVVCKISFNSLSLIKDRLNYKKWRFHQLRTGRAGGPEKWDEIQAHRSKMMQDRYFAPIKDILVRAEKRGALMRKLYANAPCNYQAEAFAKGAVLRVAEASTKILSIDDLDISNPSLPVKVATEQPSRQDIPVQKETMQATRAENTDVIADNGWLLYKMFMSHEPYSKYLIHPPPVDAPPPSPAFGSIHAQASLSALPVALAIQDAMMKEPEEDSHDEGEPAASPRWDANRFCRNRFRAMPYLAKYIPPALKETPELFVPLIELKSCSLYDKKHMLKDPADKPPGIDPNPDWECLSGMGLCED